jgi:hypothetical protein
MKKVIKIKAKDIIKKITLDKIAEIASYTDIEIDLNDFKDIFKSVFIAENLLFEMIDNIEMIKIYNNFKHINPPNIIWIFKLNKDLCIENILLIAERKGITQVIIKNNENKLRDKNEFLNKFSFNGSSKIYNFFKDISDDTFAKSNFYFKFVEKN